MNAPARPSQDEDTRRSLHAVASIDAIPAILDILRRSTGMRFAAVARVTDDKWLACATQDDAGLGLGPGGELDINTTLCKEARQTGKAIAFDCASENPLYREHMTPRMYGFESYISTPILLPDGSYFGNLCALDPERRGVASEAIQGMFAAYATLIGQLLGSWERMGTLSDSLDHERNVAGQRERFLAVVTHDLRNPLATVAASAELLARRDDEPSRRLGSRLRGSAERMRGLIDDLGDYVRGRAGQGMVVALTERPDLAADLEAVVEEARATAPGRTIESAIALGDTLVCDGARVQQVLSNLLGNALAYGDPQRPIRAEAHTDHGEAVVAVTNWGEPIDAERLQAIFDPYWRASQDNHRSDHMGLGLHICQQIADSHGGTLTVNSDAENGTRFEMRWPACP